MITIKEILVKHEDLKAKWLRLNEDNIYTRIWLRDSIIDLIVEKKSIMLEERLKLKVEKWIERVKLKNKLDDKGKKVHTEWTADAVIDEMYYEKDISQERINLEIELLQEKKKIIQEYINLWKKIVFKNW